MAVTRVREDPDVTAQPEPEEPHESRLVHPRLRALSLRDWRGILVRSVKGFMADNGTMLASALAYSTFFAIPATLLVVVGAFTLVVGPETITTVMRHFSTVIPGDATSLLGGSLHRLDRQPSTGVAVTIVGAVLALWSTTSAMSTYMTALNLAYERKDRRSFLRKRLVALERLVESHAGGASGAVVWIWWVAEWPILIAGLLAAFSTLLHLGPDLERQRWRFLTPGSVLATALWLAVSGGFAYYTSSFASYNKTWGSLAAVIVLLTWLWLAAVALLLGAELNAETERSLELQAGEL